MVHLNSACDSAGQNTRTENTRRLPTFEGKTNPSGMRIRRDAPELTRRHVYIDTMGLHPALVGSVVELLGADHVLAGTDWPIVVEKDVAGRLQKALTVAGLSAEQQQMVAGGNTLRLLGIA